MLDEKSQVEINLPDWISLEVTFNGLLLKGERGTD
jgi:hypothetical protein